MQCTLRHINGCFSQWNTAHTHTHAHKEQASNFTLMNIYRRIKKHCFRIEKEHFGGAKKKLLALENESKLPQFYVDFWKKIYCALITKCAFICSKLLSCNLKSEIIILE